MESILVHDPKRQIAPVLGAIRSAINDTLESGRYILGDAVDKFERVFAEFCGTQYAVGVANGTDALELALRAVGVKAGDKVVTVANAGGYASIAISAIGAIPVFVDVSAATMNVDIAAFSQALAQKPSAAIVTHLYGRLAPITEICELADKAGVAVIEDCAQAHGANVDGRRAGSYGVAGCFSFYPTKNLGALGDGGAVVTNDSGVAATVRSLRQYGWAKKYHVSKPNGRNSRLDELQAAVLLARLPMLEQDNLRRREIAGRYHRQISNLHILAPQRGNSEDVVHLYVALVKERETLMSHLHARGVGCDIHYPMPDHLQMCVMPSLVQRPLPVTERLSKEVLTLPCHPALTENEIIRIIAACNEFQPSAR
jgi:dTDP-3-amino-2,3,6-trideoxy-4-keto-D-glucose/dTDP-3-amino-3,4,6-trideoxy-alpha-D-glucose/dTDP-2,6-dideoxy-D-kanosamine transaminase